MQYPAPDGTIIESSSNGPVIYTCPSPSNWISGTYESLETSSGITNIEQIKIVRVINNGTVTITITERTQQEIEGYFQNLEQ
jgi:hypothetical protein